MRVRKGHITTVQTEKNIWQVQAGYCVIGWVRKKGGKYLMDFDDSLGADRPDPLRIGEASTLEEAALAIYKHGWELEKELRRQFRNGTL